MSKLISAFGALVAVAVGSGAPGQHFSQSQAYPPAALRAASSQATAQAPAEPMTVSARLAAMPAGKVDLSLNREARQVVARLAVFGLTPGSTHRVALFAGRDGGRASVVFPDVTADAGGRLSQTVSGQAAHALGDILADPFFQIDQGPTVAGGGGENPEVGVAHTRLAPSAPGRVTLAVNGLLARSGRASLSYNAAAHTLSVSVEAAGLKPNTRHAAHIHSGSCQVQGPVVYGLPDLVAGADGTATLKATVNGVMTPPPAQGWYVNVHEGDMNQILVNGQPGPLFQPVLCGNVGSR
ncbi:MAG: CHRD domain-containing protein [Actinobacteria bacterium]|nr:CHRD domain-containing protein [Actinomycetota bacterium]